MQYNLTKRVKLGLENEVDFVFFNTDTTDNGWCKAITWCQPRR